METLLQTAEQIAIRAGALAQERRIEGVELAGSKSSIVDIVTAADVEVERFVVEQLRELRPDDGILGEEGTCHEGTSGLTWVIDPIDGTVNYLYGVADFAVSIAAVRGPARIAELTPETWQAEAACVVLPRSALVFSAARGQGATCNDERLQAEGPQSLETALVATGFGYTAERRRAQGAVIARLLPQVRDIRRLGAAAVDLCLVAAGRVDGYFEYGVRAWDVAAGLLIAEEAGCGVTARAHGGELFVVAESPSLGGALCAAVDAAGADLGAAG